MSDEGTGAPLGLHRPIHTVGPAPHSEADYHCFDPPPGQANTRKPPPDPRPPLYTRTCLVVVNAIEGIARRYQISIATAIFLIACRLGRSELTILDWLICGPVLDFDGDAFSAVVERLELNALGRAEPDAELDVSLCGEAKNET